MGLILDFLYDLWPINRSISGSGLRLTLQKIKEKLPELELIEVPSGTKVLDWIVPEEWDIEEAVLSGPDGHVIADFKVNNLSVLGYSIAVDTELSLDELQPHLFSIKEQPDLIPYATSYYKKNWGFCIAENDRQHLPQGNYKALIKSKHFLGSITLAHLIIPGESKQEVLFSTYCCHPSMANNELSGPCVATFLAEWVSKIENRKYTYRFIFIPEMIGSAAYLELYSKELKENVIASFNLTCVGDERAWSYLPSRNGNTYADKVALHVLNNKVKSFDSYKWLDRGSDESMFCAPGIDIPMVSIMRSKYGTYPEYHTSADLPSTVVTEKGLEDSLEIHKTIVELIERNVIPVAQVLGEPQLGRRGLYPMVSVKGSTNKVKNMLNLISYSDGKLSLLEIAEKCETPIWTLYEEIEKLLLAEVLSVKNGKK